MIIIYTFIIFILVEFVGYTWHRFINHYGLFGDKIRVSHYCHHEEVYPYNDMVAGMKAAIIGGESNTAMISLATTWTNDYSPSDTFQVNPSRAVPVEKIGGVNFASNSNFLAITSNNEMITTDDEPADYSVFINKDNL